MPPPEPGALEKLFRHEVFKMLEIKSMLKIKPAFGIRTIYDSVFLLLREMASFKITKTGGYSNEARWHLQFDCMI
jgi:hypothetical protein